MFSVVCSQTQRKISGEYRTPYTFYLPQDPYPRTPQDIVGIGIAGSDDHVYVWYQDGMVSSGTSRHLAEYRPPYSYNLPPEKTPGDIVGMGIAGSDDHVYAWYRDGKVSSGTSWDLTEYRPPYSYNLPPEKTPGDIVGMAIRGWKDQVYTLYKDGTMSRGTSRDLAQYSQPYSYTLPPGASHGDIVGMGYAKSDDIVYVWYRSSGAATGDLAAVDWCYTIYEPPGAGQTITITFHPRIENVGSFGWASPNEGSYWVAASWGSEIVSKTHNLHSYPHWMIGPGETKTLEGVTVPFHPNNIYNFLGWHFTHPDDTNSNNNEFTPKQESIKGSRFEKGGDMAHKECS